MLEKHEQVVTTIAMGDDGSHSRANDPANASSPGATGTLVVQQSSEQGVESPILEDLLVEDVSIDGMCGVY